MICLVLVCLIRSAREGRRMIEPMGSIGRRVYVRKIKEI